MGNRVVAFIDLVHDPAGHFTEEIGVWLTIHLCPGAKGYIGGD